MNEDMLMTSIWYSWSINSIVSDQLVNILLLVSG